MWVRWQIWWKGRSGSKTYTTVGTVRPSSLLGGLVDLDVLDDEVAGVEALGISVGLSVLEQTEQELGRLDGPAGLGDTKLLAYRRKKFHQHAMSCNISRHLE